MGSGASGSGQKATESTRHADTQSVPLLPKENDNPAHRPAAENATSLGPAVQSGGESQSRKSPSAEPRMRGGLTLANLERANVLL